MDERKFNDFERIKRQTTIFNEIGKTLTSSLTINEVLEKIFYKVAEFFRPERRIADMLALFYDLSTPRARGEV